MYKDQFVAQASELTSLKSKYSRALEEKRDLAKQVEELQNRRCPYSREVIERRIREHEEALQQLRGTLKEVKDAEKRVHHLLKAVLPSARQAVAGAHDAVEEIQDKKATATRRKTRAKRYGLDNSKDVEAATAALADLEKELETAQRSYFSAVRAHRTVGDEALQTALKGCPDHVSAVIRALSYVEGVDLGEEGDDSDAMHDRQSVIENSVGVSHFLSLSCYKDVTPLTVSAFLEDGLGTCTLPNMLLAQRCDVAGEKGSYRQVVLKQVPLSNSRHVHRFFTEVAVMRHAAGAGVVPLTDAFTDRIESTGTLYGYLEMPYYHLGSLAELQVTAGRNTKGGGQTTKQDRLRERLRLRPLAHALLVALARLHELGVVHRDIKPANVLLVDEEAEGKKSPQKGSGKEARTLLQPLLADFGISRTVGEGNVNAPTTTNATIAFSPNYASPEVLRGERATPAADVYSLGLLLLDMARALEQPPLPPRIGENQAKILDLIDELPSDRPSSTHLKNLLYSMLEERTTFRCSSSSLLKVRYFADVADADGTDDNQDRESKPRVPRHWKLKKDYPARIDVTDKVKGPIQALISATCSNTLISRQGQLSVYRVERVQSLAPWWRFEATKRAMVANSKREQESRGPEPAVPKTMMPDTASLPPPALDSAPPLREAWLWHGTKPERVGDIVSEGMNERLSDLGGLLGACVYFSDDIDKAFEYASPDKDGNRYIFLCRVLRGRVLTTRDTQANRRHLALDRSDSIALELDKNNHDGYSHREFGVYDGSLVYPEYLLMAQYMYKNTLIR